MVHSRKRRKYLPATATAAANAIGVYSWQPQGPRGNLTRRAAFPPAGSLSWRDGRRPRAKLPETRAAMPQTYLGSLYTASWLKCGVVAWDYVVIALVPHSVGSLWRFGGS